jgi:predicted nucleotidyltransferase
MDATASVLFGKTRQAVLAELADSLEQGLYLRELQRRTGISTGALHHELGQLMKADLVERFEDGNRVNYRLNRSHPIHDELRRIVEKTCGLPARIREALAPQSQRIDWAAIFGSIAQGTSHAASDVDMLIVGEVTPAEIIECIQPLESDLGREIGFRLYTPEEFAERRESDGFLQKVLSRPLIELLGPMHDA